MSIRLLFANRVEHFHWNSMEILIATLTFLLLFGGVMGVFLPVIPTPLLSWLGILICYLGWEQGPVAGWFLAMATLLTVFAHVFEFIGSYFGAKWFGATWRGGVGALLGGVAGPVLFFFLPIPGGVFAGLILGPVAGALIGELLGKRAWADATKAGLGTVVGNLAAMLFKLAVCLFLLVGFTIAIAIHVGAPLAAQLFPESSPTETTTPAPSEPIPQP